MRVQRPRAREKHADPGASVCQREDNPAVHCAPRDNDGFWMSMLQTWMNASSVAEGTKMNKVTFATIAAAGLAAAAFGLTSPASAAPTDVGSAQDTINSLQAQGYEVIVHKVGNAPLSQCSVSAIKPGHTFSRTDSGAPGAMGDLTTTIVSKSVTVYLSC